MAWPWKANEVSEFELVPDAFANEPLNVHLALRIHELGIPSENLPRASFVFDGSRHRHIFCSERMRRIRLEALAGRGTSAESRSNFLHLLRAVQVATEVHFLGAERELRRTDG